MYVMCDESSLHACFFLHLKPRKPSCMYMCLWASLACLRAGTWPAEAHARVLSPTGEARDRNTGQKQYVFVRTCIYVCLCACVHVYL
jgi:hypothetical protein